METPPWVTGCVCVNSVGRWLATTTTSSPRTAIEGMALIGENDLGEAITAMGRCLFQLQRNLLLET